MDVRTVYTSVTVMDPIVLRKQGAYLEFSSYGDFGLEVIGCVGGERGVRRDDLEGYDGGWGVWGGINCHIN